MPESSQLKIKFYTHGTNNDTETGSLCSISWTLEAFPLNECLRSLNLTELLSQTFLRNLIYFGSDISVKYSNSLIVNICVWIILDL